MPEYPRFEAPAGQGCHLGVPRRARPAGPPVLLAFRLGAIWDPDLGVPRRPLRAPEAKSLVEAEALRMDPRYDPWDPGSGVPRRPLRPNP